MKNEIDIDNALLELEENDELYSTVFDEEVKKCNHTFYEVWFVNEDKTPFEYIETRCTMCGFVDNTI